MSSTTAQGLRTMSSTTVDATVPNRPPRDDLPVPVGREPETAILGPIDSQYDIGPKIAREGRLFGAYVHLNRCGGDPAIVLLAKQCLAVDPDERPADAGVLAEPVNRCLEGLADRAKAMELGKPAAQSPISDLRAQERLARKARGLARGLAATAAVVAGLVVSGLWWYADARSARAAAEAGRFTAAVVGIETALAEADAQIEDARRAPGGPYTRHTAARLATAAWQRADTLVEATAGVPDSVRERLTETKGRIDEAERGTRLAVALEGWRTELIDPKGVFDPAAAARRCADTLAAHGFDVRPMTPEAAAAALVDHPAGPRIREVLADWLAVTEAPAERQHLAAVLTATGDAPPAAWLAALDADDPAALANLSPDAIPAAGVAVGARLLARAGQTAAAERLLTRGVRKHPESFTLNAQLGSLLRARPGARGEAIRYLSVAVASRPTDATVGYELGSALADAGRADEAIGVLVRAVEVDPKHAPAQVRLGDLFAAKGDDYAANEQYRIAAAADPGYAPAQVRLGERELAAGNVEPAERAFRAAAESEPRDLAARSGLARVLLQKGDAAGAAAEFRSAVETDPSDSASRSGLVEALTKTGDRPAATREAKAAASVAPTDGSSQHTLGLLLRERGDRMEALAAFRSAARCASPTADTFRQMGELYEEARDPRSAADAYARAAELEPKDVALWTALGRAREAAGHPADALEAYRRLLTLTPASAAVRHHVGRLATATDDESGLADLTAAAAALPDSPDVKADLGIAQAKFGRFREGVTTLRRASAMLSPGHARGEEIDAAIRHANRSAALESRLPDILNGAVTPSSPAGWAQVGEVARRTNRLAAAARLYLRAIEADEYKAAAAAVLALAAAGHGTDAWTATAEDRAGWREAAVRLWHTLPADARTNPAFDGLTDRAAWDR